MSDEYGVNSHYRSDSSASWFVAGIVAFALLAIGYMVFSADNPAERSVTEKQAACMIANPGLNCAEVTRWEPVAAEVVSDAR